MEGKLVNTGYQRDDQNILDYQLWKYADLFFRGPKTDFASPYFSALGAAQVFGRFVEEPFPSILAKKLGIPAFNAGSSGAGPSFFLQRPELINTVNRGKFTIIHMMSGRSVSNSWLKVSKNQGVLSKRSLAGSIWNEKGQGVFAEDAYKELLSMLPTEDLLSLRIENRFIYVQQMRQLLEEIKTPKILLYWSTRKPEYSETITSIGGFWGGFPHFVNRQVINQLRPYADMYLEVVGNPGLPQALHNCKTNDPILMWPEDKFPDVKLRCHNHYYPSPEMNVDVANELVTTCQSIASATSRGYQSKKPEGNRHILIHFHIFKNAGTSIDRSLQECFGNGWLPLDPEKNEEVFTLDDISEQIESRPNVAAISSHQVRFSPQKSLNFKFYPIVMLRHPILRVKSIYDFERTTVRRAQSKAIHTEAANQMTFQEWIEWSLKLPTTAAPLANYQTRMCSFTANGAKKGDWSAQVTMNNYEEALSNLENAYVGTLGAFSQSLRTIEARLKYRFPTLVMTPYVTNTSMERNKVTDRSIDSIRSEMRPAVYSSLCEANCYDLLLYRTFSSGHRE